MDIGWREIDGQWHYFNENGEMQTGWQYINGNSYYFDEKGIWKQ
ncbi:hypothetical protein [Clostridium perfringens]|nr:hypothetical protein [Clostridium perfringens]